MGLRKAKVQAPFGLGAAELTKEAQTVKKGCIRWVERKIKNEDVMVILVNREDGFTILALGNDGVKKLYGADSNGK